MSMREPCALCGVVEWAYGVKYEQERIIKLLPEIIAMGNICDMLSLEDEMSDLLPDAIALIKGENNNG